MPEVPQRLAVFLAIWRLRINRNAAEIPLSLPTPEPAIAFPGAIRRFAGFLAHGSCNHRTRPGLGRPHRLCGGGVGCRAVAGLLRLAAGAPPGRAASADRYHAQHL